MTKNINNENKAKKLEITIRVIKFCTVAIFAIVIFSIGFWTGNTSNSLLSESNLNQNSSQALNAEEIPEYLTKEINFDLFWQTWDYIKKDYVNDNVLDTKLFYGAMKGVVASLEDPYSVFLEPTVSKKFQEELSGSFEGIGAEIGIRDGILTVISPLSESPAERVGIKAGDKILAIDDYETMGIFLDHAVNLIRGLKGTTVVLTILHEDAELPVEIEVVRDTIKIISVSWSMEKDNIALIKLDYFHEDTLERFNKVAKEILNSRAKGIILDLRNNPGGYLETAIEIVSYWTGGDKVVVLEKKRNNKTINHKPVNDKNVFKDFPTVVLINQGSASGSEIVAGALQDFESAKIIGETSFGKGSVQELKKLSDGSSIKLTVAKWLTPAGREIDEEGIIPDIEVKLTQEDFSASLDPQLDKAYEILASKAIY